MSEDIADRLRQLARDHSAGRLGLLDYRKLRAPLLDFLIVQRRANGNEESTVTQPRAPALPVDEPTSTSSADASAAAKVSPDSALTKTTKHVTFARRIWKLIFAALLVAAALVGTRYLGVTGN